MENIISAITWISDACCLEFIMRKAKGKPLFSYIPSAMKFLKGQMFLPK